jgi:hypothetical protein
MHFPRVLAKPCVRREFFWQPSPRLFRPDSSGHCENMEFPGSRPGSATTPNLLSFVYSTTLQSQVLLGNRFKAKILELIQDLADPSPESPLGLSVFLSLARSFLLAATDFTYGQH